MNLPTKIVLIAIAAAIIVPLFFSLRKKAMGSVRLEFDSSSIDPDGQVSGTVAFRFSTAGQTGPVRLTLRCTERLDGNGQPTSGIRAEEHFVLSEGLTIVSRERQQLAFSVELPTDPAARAQTAHATQGSMPSMLRKDFDWWCVVEIEGPGGISFSAIERIPLVAK